MNYRHSYHAGNFCDVFKHNIIMFIIQHLLHKSKSFATIDTHSGCGFYDLNDLSALKTGEFLDGVKLLWDSKDKIPSIFESYIKILEKYNDVAINIYPGSPIVCSDLLRKIDMQYLNELHTEDYQFLQDAMIRRNCNIKNMDGYLLLKSYNES